MHHETFTRTVELDAPADEVFRWHARPGAFQRLVPPWENLVTRGPDARLVPGARQDISLRIGPVGLPWKAEIESVEPDRGFVDVQTEGPFRSWRHEHRMLAGDPPQEGRSVLEDRVSYALPLGLPARVLAGRSVRRRLERTFAYRHRVTESDLARHASTRGAPPLDILVSGANGMVGRALVAFLSTGGHRVRRLVRRVPRGADEFRWDPLSGSIDPGAAEGADAVVHLAGENIAGGRWSPDRKDRIRRSRREGTRHVADAVRAAHDKPRVFLSAAAVGIYGDRGDEILDETSTEGTGYLADVCRAWEAQARYLGGVRAVSLRFGVVLSPAGGALRKMLLPFQLGLGGPVGSGGQWMSWVALDDVVFAIHHALHDAGLEGPVNVVSPNPVTNRDFTRTLGRVLRRPTLIPMPGFAARAAFGELADELLLAGQRVQPRRLEESGYEFAYPELEGALRHMLGRMA